MRIELIGPPRIVDGQRVASVRGHKSWALLARVLLADRPLHRRDLAAELFPDADDPLGSLRWCLAALRRAIDCRDSLTGDPIEARLPEGTVVDVWSLGDASTDPDPPDGELLEGLDPAGGPELETWLLVERARVASIVDAQLRRRIIASLATGSPDRAVELASTLVRRRPYDESARILLIRSLVGAGHVDAAEQEVDNVGRLFREELGVEPSPAVASAARASVADPAPGVSLVATARTALESGLAALSAGAVDAGLDCLRRACDAADRSGDEPLAATAAFELGVALVHVARGHDDEGSVLLGQAAEDARRLGVPEVAAGALRELGYIDALAGRRPTAAVYLDDALEFAGDDADMLAGIHAVAGMNLVDWGRSAEGLERYRSAIELARSAEKPRRAAWALGLGAWGLLGDGDLEAARAWLNGCLDIVDDERWLAFRPWPLTLLGEVDLLEGRAARDVTVDQESVFAMSVQLEDCCWEGAAARTLALAHSASGDHGAALRWISDARARCRRHTDPFVSLEGRILAADVQLSTAAGDLDRADRSTRELLAVAAAAHLDGLVDHAYALLSG